MPLYIYNPNRCSPICFSMLVSRHHVQPHGLGSYSWHRHTFSSWYIINRTFSYPITMKNNVYCMTDICVSDDFTPENVILWQDVLLKRLHCIITKCNKMRMHTIYYSVFQGFHNKQYTVILNIRSIILLYMIFYLSSRVLSQIN